MENIIYVDNLKCGGCAGSITSRLNKLEGMEEVKVDVEAGKVAVHHAENLTREEILKTLAKLGYPEQGTSNLYQKAVSYVSCATGRMNS
jgi:copper chaperone CopZ